MAIISNISDQNLNYNSRPGFVKKGIALAFNEIKNSKHGWKYNGESSYYFFEIKEHELFAKMIQNAPKGRKNFYALDVGAGNFSWVDGCAKFINQQTHLPEGIKIHIIGIRGEQNGLEFSEEEVGRCKLYKLGAFKIENLFREFQKRGLQIEGELDLVVSRWTLCHCVDPVSIVMQIHDMLRPKTGLFFFDAFHFKYEDEGFFKNCVNIPPRDDFLDPIDPASTRARIIRLLLDMKAPFLLQTRSNPRDHDVFLLQRKMQNHCALQMKYSKVCALWGDRVEEIAASGKVVQFKRTPQKEDVYGFDFPQACNGIDIQFHGSKALYTCLRTYQLFRTIYRLPKWVSIQPKDQDTASAYMRRYAIEGDLSQIKRWIADADINQADDLGRTALHLALIHQKKEIVSFLLEAGASVHLSSDERKTPLAYAAAIDREGTMIEALLAAGASIDGKDDWEHGISPLDCSIQAKNTKAIALLLEKGAIASQQNLVALESKEFLDLHRKGLIPLQTQGANFMRDILFWIESGYCVVLHENGSRVKGYYKEEKQGPIKKLVVVDFHPNQNLLAPGELPEYHPRFTGLSEFNALDQTQFDSRFAFSLGY